MAFTDDDLKRLKEETKGDEEPPWYLEALLARLEAAERCILRTTQDEEGLIESEDYTAWRQAAGK